MQIHVGNKTTQKLNYFGIFFYQKTNEVLENILRKSITSNYMML